MQTELGLKHNSFLLQAGIWAGLDSAQEVNCLSRYRTLPDSAAEHWVLLRRKDVAQRTARITQRKRGKRALGR